MSRSAIPLFSLLLIACGQPIDEAPEVSKPQSLSASWRPFDSDSPWNTRLSSSRRESALSSRAMGTGPMGVSDGDYGIGFFAADSDDPTWTISYDGYNNGSSYDSDGTLRLKGPSNMRAASGSDATVILVDESRRYAYEMWNFDRSSSGRASAAYVVRVDLNSDGVREGITGGGVPAIGGVLRYDELGGSGPIRHKLWVAAHPDIVYERHDWPALRHDVRETGRYAALEYGDVVALTKDYSFSSNPCDLSPFMQRIARALQEYGGIVVDKGGDSLGFPAQINAVRDHIDIDYDDEMWHQFTCMKRYMVRVTNPWG